MKKFIYVLGVVSLIMISLSTVAEAKLYVCLDKTTGEPTGVASISDTNIPEWAERRILIPADESYRGKHGWEIKYKNGKLKHATQSEKDEYKEQKRQEREARKKSDALETLGLTDEDMQKIKNLP